MPLDHKSDPENCPTIDSDDYPLDPTTPQVHDSPIDGKPIFRPLDLQTDDGFIPWSSPWSLFPALYPVPAKKLVKNPSQES